MNNGSTGIESSAVVELLPAFAYTLSGVRFEPAAHTWSFQDGTYKVHINFARIEAGCRDLETPLRWVLLAVLRSSSPQYASNLFEAFVHFSRKLSAAGAHCESVEVRHFQLFKATLLPNEKHRESTLASLLQMWRRLNQPGVEEECTAYLREITKVSNTKGRAVRTQDPIKGPLTETEYKLLYRALDHAYGAGQLDSWAFVLGRLLFAAGARISQYASMKLCDLTVSAGADGSARFQVQLPQIKKGAVHSRVHLKGYDLSPQTGQLLHDFIQGRIASGFTPDAPLFPSLRKSAGEGMFKGHCTGVELGRRLMTALRIHAPATVRLNGEPLRLTATRFRYTLATRLAEEGCSLAVIADRLGHSDLQNVRVYYEASPKLVRAIDDALTEPLTPVAAAFAGRVIPNETQATLAGQPSSKIRDLRAAPSGVGSCGDSGPCSFSKPEGCYSCASFEPWLDAPHEKVLFRLIEERERHRLEPRIAMVNDVAILAVREVIAACSAARGERGEDQRDE